MPKALMGYQFEGLDAEISFANMHHIYSEFDRQDGMRKLYDTFMDTIRGANWDGNFQFSASECWDFYMNQIDAFLKKKNEN